MLAIYRYCTDITDVEIPQNRFKASSDFFTVYLLLKTIYDDYESGLIVKSHMNSTSFL